MNWLGMKKKGVKECEKLLESVSLLPACNRGRRQKESSLLFSGGGEDTGWQIEHHQELPRYSQGIAQPKAAAAAGAIKFTYLSFPF